jgi:hypothetical protein
MPRGSVPQYRNITTSNLYTSNKISLFLPFKDEAQTALFEDPVRTAL